MLAIELRARLLSVEAHEVLRPDLYSMHVQIIATVI